MNKSKFEYKISWVQGGEMKHQVEPTKTEALKTIAIIYEAEPEVTLITIKKQPR